MAEAGGGKGGQGEAAGEVVGSLGVGVDKKFDQAFSEMAIEVRCRVQKNWRLVERFNFRSPEDLLANVDWQFGIPQLPLEVGLHVFDLVDQSHLRKNLSKVCKAWRCVILASVDSIAVGNQYNHRRARLKMAGTMFLNLRRLDVSRCTWLKDADLKHLAQCKKLVRLDMAKLENISDEGLQNLPESLTTLDLKGCDGITDECLAKLPRALRHLRLTNCFNITGVGFDKLPDLVSLICNSRKPHIVSLRLPKTLEMVRLPKSGSLPDLSQFNALKFIEAEDCGEIDSAHVPPGLETMSLVAPKISNYSRTFAEGLSKCSSVRNLRIVLDRGDAIPLETVPRHVKCLSIYYDSNNLKLDGLPPELEYFDIARPVSPYMVPNAASLPITEEDLTKIPSSVTVLDITGHKIAARLIKRVDEDGEGEEEQQQTGIAHLISNVKCLLVGDRADKSPVGGPCDWDPFPFKERTRKTLVHERSDGALQFKLVDLIAMDEECNTRRVGAEMNLGARRQRKTVDKLSALEVMQILHGKPS